MCYCKELIVSENESIGLGTPSSPYRSILQIFDKDGNLIAKKDPLGGFTIEDIYEFESHLKSGGTINDFKRLKRNIATL